MKSKITQPPRLSNRIFGIVFSTIFFIVVAIAWFIFNQAILWLLWISLGLALVTLLAPWILLPLNRLWCVFAIRLGIFNNHLLLGTFFFLFMVPIGFIVRLLGKDPMTRKKKDTAISYWTPINRHAEPDTFSDLF